MSIVIQAIFFDSVETVPENRSESSEMLDYYQMLLVFLEEIRRNTTCGIVFVVNIPGVLRF